MKAFALNYMKVSLAIILTVMAVTSEPFAGEAVSVGLPPLPGEIMKEVDNNLTSQQLSPQGVLVYDTVYFNFNITLEGWDFLNHPDTVQEYYPDEGCVQQWRMISNGAPFNLSWQHFDNTGTARVYCPFRGYWEDTCYYSWRIKSINGSTPQEWDGVYRIQTRVYWAVPAKAPGDTIYAMIGYKRAGDTYFNYLGWTDPLPTYSWSIISIDEPSPGAFADLEAVSILFGAYYSEGYVYIDWVRGISQRATVLRVPSVYPTIQAAIDSSTEGDTILVAPGIYTGDGNRDLYIWHYQPIVLKSESGPENTIIDCQGSSGDPHSGLYLDYYSSPDNVVEGFTFRGGYSGEGSGAGIYMYNIGPTIRNCVFENNVGGAITCQYASPLVANCKFVGNTYYSGGALYCYSSSPTLTGCLFDGNTAQEGGAIYYYGSSAAYLMNCTFVNNSAKYGGGIYFSVGDVEASTISNCIIAFSTQGGAIYVEYVDLSLLCCDIYGNVGGDWVGDIADQYGVNGNFSDDPLFCDFANGNYEITANSPCAPANNSCETLIGAYGVGCNAIEIVLSPTSIDFSASEGESNPPPDTLIITNAGGGVLAWTLSKSASWLNVSTNQGTAPSTVIVTADISGLTAGLYTDTIIVIAEDAVNSPQYVPVTLTVQVAGEIALSPDSMHFSADSGDANPNSQDLTITNTGGGVLMWTLSKSAEWLSVSDFVGTAPSIVTVTVDITDLTPNHYFDTITVFSENATNSPQHVPVTLTIDIANRPPEFVEFCSDTVLVEGDRYEYEMVVSDPDSDPINFSCQQCPAGAELTSSGDATALFSFEPDYRHVDGSYMVIIEASDGAAAVSDSFTISVVNRQLEVISIQPHSSEGQDFLIKWKPIEIQFNEALNESSLEDGVSISSRKGDLLNHAYDNGQYLLTFDNTSDYLMCLDTIICTLHANILDMANKPLGSEYVYEFYTGVAVFPGDANDDGIVDERDILPMGLYWGNEGPSRSDSSDVFWETKPAHVYASGKRWMPLASVYADANGSGKVDAEDICGVTSNWAQQVASGKLTDLGVEVDLEAALKHLEGNVLQRMYEGLVNCPESEGKASVMKVFESLLDEPVASLPTTYQLSQNYPNPFNPYTVIRFYLPQSGHATLSVYNIMGQKVAVLLDGNVDKGYSEVTWDGADQSGRPVASGIYFYRLESGEVSITRRMMLLK